MFKDMPFHMFEIVRNGFIAKFIAKSIYIYIDLI